MPDQIQRKTPARDVVFAALQDQRAAMTLARGAKLVETHPHRPHDSAVERAIRVETGDRTTAVPGTILDLHDDSFTVATATDAIVLSGLQK